MSTFYKAGRKKANKVFRRLVPYNMRYRPTGVCRINLNNLEEIKNNEIVVHSIYPNAVTTLNISEDLYNATSAYWKPKRKVETDYVVVEVPNGRLYTENESSVAILSRFSRIIENISLSLAEGKVTEPNLNSIFEQRFFTTPTKFDGTVFSMLTGGAGINNISHWFVDVLPRLHLLKESGLYDKIDWFLVPSLRYDYQRETLEMLGITADKIIEGDVHTHITADCIVASTAPRGNHTLVPVWLCNYLQNTFMPFSEEGGSTLQEDSPYLYISRSDSSIRNVLNEKELQESIAPYGFKTVVSSKLSIKEKIKLFANAKVVMGACGAGLINMIFCKPGTTLIEIYTEGFILEPFYDIANKIGLDHRYVICKGNKYVKNATQGQREHMIVEIDKVMALLKEVPELNSEEQSKAHVL